MTKFIIISDTHSKHELVDIPEGDILLHAGDFTKRGSLEDVNSFNDWLGTLPHSKKIIIAGNHDFCFEKQNEDARKLMTNAVYLQDELIEIEGLKIYGSPWQPWFFDWAFNLPRGIELKKKWDLIPTNIDVLMTHGPPHGILDKINRGKSVGCEELRLRVEEIQPKLHVFGHIHEDYGTKKINKTTYINGSSCDLGYEPINKPIVIEL